MQSLPDYPDQPELALVAALTLISRYSCCKSPALADAAVSQLQAVANDQRFSDELRACGGTADAVSGCSARRLRARRARSSHLALSASPSIVSPRPVSAPSRIQG